MSVFRATESLLCLRAVLTGLSFIVVLKSGGGSSSRGLLWFPQRRQLSRLTGLTTGIIQTECPERNEVTCDSVYVVKSDRREQDLEKQRGRNPNFF